MLATSHATPELLAGMQPRPGRVVAAWSNVRRLACVCTRAKIDRISCNDLRRTYASWLKQRGVDSLVVARLLGHTSTRMVDAVYGQLDELLSPSNRILREPPSTALQEDLEVPRGGFEPPTRGFSVLGVRAGFGRETGRAGRFPAQEEGAVAHG